MDRRTFIQSALMAIPGWHLARAQEGGRRLRSIGLQLYTVRYVLEKDFAGTLARVAETGYQEVEFAGYFGRSPGDIRTLLDRLKLAAPSAHVPLEDVRDPARLQKVLDGARQLGHKYVVCPWVDPSERSSLDDWKKLGAILNRAGEATRKAGMQFAWHNHDFEFAAIDGKLPYDILLAQTDAELVKMQLDLYWTTKGGHDPVKYFQQHPERFVSVHVKDMDATARRWFTDVGAGTIDFKRLLAGAEQAGIEHYFVEHDEPKDPFATIRNSLEFLKQLRY